MHNLGKALANEDVDDNSTKQVSSPSEKKQMSMEHVLGCGYVVSPKNAPVPSSGLVDHAEFSSLAVKPAEKLFLGPLGNKRTAYLSAFILYIATVGDIVDGVDTTHDYNFFSLVYERPNDVCIIYSCFLNLITFTSIYSFGRVFCCSTYAHCRS